MRYHRIFIKGQLDLSWQEWFEDLQILPEASNETVLYGLLLDQAALYRVLLKINSLGLTLLSLETYEVAEAQGHRRKERKMSHTTLTDVVGTTLTDVVEATFKKFNIPGVAVGVWRTARRSLPSTA